MFFVALYVLIKISKFYRHKNPTTNRLNKAYGVIEDVIDRIKNFYFLADFLVVDVKLRKELRKGSIILDRPLVTIVKVVISLGRRS